MLAELGWKQLEQIALDRQSPDAFLEWRDSGAVSDGALWSLAGADLHPCIKKIRIGRQSIKLGPSVLTDPPMVFFWAIDTEEGAWRVLIPRLGWLASGDPVGEVELARKWELAHVFPSREAAEQAIAAGKMELPKWWLKTPYEQPVIQGKD
jgi:hypothetical protein